jgi:hypothetical protein
MNHCMEGQLMQNIEIIILEIHTNYIFTSISACLNNAGSVCIYRNDIFSTLYDLLAFIALM